MVIFRQIWPYLTIALLLGALIVSIARPRCDCFTWPQYQATMKGIIDEGNAMSADDTPTPEPTAQPSP